MSVNDQNTGAQSKMETEIKIDHNDKFLKWFEIMQCIYNESNCVKNIISAVSDGLGDHAAREIIRAGIKSFSKDHSNDDSKIISKIRQQFELSQLQNHKPEKVSTSDDNIDYSSFQNELFGISDVSCYIFQYLDLKSRLRCKNVNLTWLYNACNPASYYHLNLDDFIHYHVDEIENDLNKFEYVNENMFVRSEDELVKLIKQSNGNIRKLTLCQWPHSHGQLFSSMVNNLTKLESIEVMQSYGDESGNSTVFDRFYDIGYPAVVENLLSINRESLKSVKLFGYKKNDSMLAYATMENIFQRMQTIFFPKLSTFSINFLISPDMLPINISQPLWRNHTNLRTVQLERVKFTDDFFKHLIKNKDLLANIETLVLHQFRNNDYQFKMFPAAMAKLTNIMHLDLHCGISNQKLICMLSKLPQASKIKTLKLQCGYVSKYSTAADSYNCHNVNNKQYNFDQLEKLHLDCDNISELKQIFKVVFKPNTISNIEQLAVGCSVNALVADLLKLDNNHNEPPKEDTISRSVLLPHLKYIECEKLTDKTDEKYTDIIIKVIKNINHCLDLFTTGACLGCEQNRLITFDLGRADIDMQSLFQLENTAADEIEHDDHKNSNYVSASKDNHQDLKKISKLTMFLEQLISLNKKDNVDCKWVCRKVSKFRHKEYNFDSIIEQMKQFNMLSSSDVQYYPMKDSTYRVDNGCTFGCYSLFNEKIRFEQDYYNIYFITQSNWSRPRK